jgi:hypothetical protein
LREAKSRIGKEVERRFRESALTPAERAAAEAELEALGRFLKDYQPAAVDLVGRWRLQPHLAAEGTGRSRSATPVRCWAMPPPMWA